MNSSQMIFYGGVLIMCAGVLFGLCSLIILRITGTKIRRQLDQEYGPKRHR